MRVAVPRPGDGRARAIHRLRSRLVACAALLALIVLPTACGLDRTLGGDACLLQQYQGRSNGMVSHIQGAVSNLSSNVDALAASKSSIDASQDISQTLTSIAEFQLNLAGQWAQVKTGALPPEGAAFRATLQTAIDRLDRGAQLLTQVYVDTANGDTRAAAFIAQNARTDFEQGRLLLGQASVETSKLATYNPNC